MRLIKPLSYALAQYTGDVNARAAAAAANTYENVFASSSPLKVKVPQGERWLVSIMLEAELIYGGAAIYSGILAVNADTPNLKLNTVAAATGATANPLRSIHTLTATDTAPHPLSVLGELWLPPGQSVFQPVVARDATSAITWRAMNMSVWPKFALVT